MAELSSQPISIQTLYSWYRNDILFVNRRYQRKLVWTLEEKQKLVDSVLRKYPIPAILIAEREEAAGTYEIIDGLQRLHALVSFIETAFPTLDGLYFNLEYFPTAKSAADEGLFTPNSGAKHLTQRQVTTFLDYTLAMSVMRNATEAEVNDVFSRINTYGHRLSDQERRQAGVENDFSEMVRTIACNIRGDVSDDMLVLRAMPSISIDLPMSRHGYDVRADEVFWVNQGVLRATDLRDSMDEQCIADIAASIVGGRIIERSKDALDQIYETGSEEANRIEVALGVYGRDRFAQEFKFCVDEILRVCGHDRGDKLRDIIYNRRTTNPFPSLFTLLVMAFHELIVDEGKSIADYAGVRTRLTGIADRLETSRKSTSPEERRKNIDTIKGLIQDCFVDVDAKPSIYGNHYIADIDATIRRSQIELADYELKQGILSLSSNRSLNKKAIQKVAKTLCAIANNGPGRHGKVLIGVCDNPDDARRISALDQIEARKVGRRFVVGVVREAKVLGKSIEEYLLLWKNHLRASGLSQPLLDSIMSHMDYNDYYGLGVLVITVPPQKKLSYFGEEIYWRDGSETKRAKTAKEIASIAQRF